MCIILFQQAEAKRLPKVGLEIFSENNSDGMGLMYSEDGKLRVWRSMDDIEALWEEYCRVHDRGIAIGIHFRIATKGKTDLANCHPFLTGNGWALMHNGTMYGLGAIPDGESDSSLFATSVIGALSEDWNERSTLFNLLSSYAKPSRLLLMHETGQWVVMNPKEQGAGTSKEYDTWFSQSGWLRALEGKRKVEKWYHGIAYPVQYRKCSKCKSTDHWTYDHSVSKVKYCQVCWSDSHNTDECALEKSVLSRSDNRTELSTLAFYRGRVFCEDCLDEFSDLDVTMLYEALTPVFVALACVHCSYTVYPTSEVLYE